MRRKKASVYAFSEDDVPPSDDPRWPEWAAIISARIQVPISSRELLEHCPEFSYALLTNILAWMDVRELVSKRRDGKIIYWQAASPKPPPTLAPVCPTCGGQWTVRQAGLVCSICGRMPEGFYP